jgi:hypothetical protein
MSKKMRWAVNIASVGEVKECIHGFGGKATR